MIRLGVFCLLLMLWVIVVVVLHGNAKGDNILIIVEFLGSIAVACWYKPCAVPEGGGTGIVIHKEIFFLFEPVFSFHNNFTFLSQNYYGII